AGSGQVIPGTHASPLTISILGQSISGIFAFEQITGQLSPQAPSTATPPKIVKISASEVAMTIGTSSAGVTLDQGHALFVQEGAGLAGTIGGHIVVHVPGDALAIDSTNFGVSINTTLKSVSEQFNVGGVAQQLTLPAGPYLRVEATGVKLTMAGQTLTGDFALETSK